MSWPVSFNTMISSFNHFSWKCTAFILLYRCIKSHLFYVSFLLYPLICWYASRWFHFLDILIFVHLYRCVWICHLPVFPYLKFRYVLLAVTPFQFQVRLYKGLKVCLHFRSSVTNNLYLGHWYGKLLDYLILWTCRPFVFVCWIWQPTWIRFDIAGVPLHWNFMESEGHIHCQDLRGWSTMWREKENKEHPEPRHITKESYLEVEPATPVLLRGFDVKQAMETSPCSWPTKLVSKIKGYKPQNWGVACCMTDDW